MNCKFRLMVQISQVVHDIVLPLFVNLSKFSPFIFVIFEADEAYLYPGIFAS